MGKKGDLSNFECGMFFGARRVFHNLLSYWDISWLTKNGVKREKHAVCGSPVGENALLMSEVRGEWAD